LTVDVRARLDDPAAARDHRAAFTEGCAGGSRKKTPGARPGVLAWKASALLLLFGRLRLVVGLILLRRRLRLIGLGGGGRDGLLGLVAHDSILDEIT
jgi:hypothetical protein